MFRERAIDFELVPLYVSPIQLEHGYARVTNLNDDYQFSSYVAATRQIDIFDYTTTWTRNTKTFKVSLIDYLQDEREIAPDFDVDWKFDEDYEDETEDTYWTGNFLGDFDVDWVENDWYGRQDYFREFYAGEDARV